ncbi:DUF3077 domain-containing protein [Pseudomonas sp. LS1212]|uniref:DUF3077 domain-containing protein n=1 Tax=Pseudomonas sp. LS1212 TaxID=2972478 RepID=UPI00215CD81E|nr:DUF3077 domain-containing protein [Pseudomonas sp. LS1212]UVJ42223.1 DUF3077 domain-containing protein [Pseudomonas sp. LS1212]
MIKIVPDPPLETPTDSAAIPGTIQQTATTTFGSCDAVHAPLFAVCGGIRAEDALVHASLLLRGAFDTAYAACDNAADQHMKGLLWSTLHSVEMAKALIDALLDGAESGDRKAEPEPTL